VVGTRARVIALGASEEIDMKERMIECPVCGEPLYVDEDDDATICECGAWLDIDEEGNVTESDI